MRTENDIRIQLRHVCTERGKQAEIARLLDVPQSTVKRWIDGSEIRPVMRKVLAWVLFGEAPARFSRPDVTLQTSLDFEADEWRVIEAMARRAGVEPAIFIRDRIRDYLAALECRHIDAPEQPTNAHLRVAEDLPEYRATGGGSSGE